MHADLHGEWMGRVDHPIDAALGQKPGRPPAPPNPPIRTSPGGSPASRPPGERADHVEPGRAAHALASSTASVVPPRISSRSGLPGASLAMPLAWAQRLGRAASGRRGGGPSVAPSAIRGPGGITSPRRGRPAARRDRTP